MIDDQAAFVETPVGIVVILGCAHAGIINTLRHVHSLVPKRPIHTVVGGTHLVSADESRMDKTVDALREMDISRIIPLHCTGSAATTRLANELTGRVSTCPAGSRLEFNTDQTEQVQHDKV